MKREHLLYVSVGALLKTWAELEMDNRSCNFKFISASLLFIIINNIFIYLELNYNLGVS